jgi:hypothetical protein
MKFVIVHFKQIYILFSFAARCSSLHKNCHVDEAGNDHLGVELG